MANITRLVKANGLNIPVSLETSHSDNGIDENISRGESKKFNNESISDAAKDLVKEYYIDELGFYRHFDSNRKQYICSNLNASNIRASNWNNNNLGSASASDQVYKIGSDVVRRELGTSHYDRTDNYEEWKRNWDDFMRTKLIKQEPVTLNNELKIRVRSGIPHDYRCKVWTAMIRMRTKNLRAETGEDIYNSILENFVFKVDVPEYSTEHSSENGSSRPLRGGSSYYRLNIDDDTSGTGGTAELTWLRSKEKVLEKCFRQIELDLLRTLPNNRHFEDPNSRGIKRVRRVLRAYACFNPAVGYCQGMNRLAAMALLVLPEEEAFWCLVAIIQCIMPRDYYLKPWLAQVDCCVLSDLLAKKMPKLHKHLVNNEIQLTLFTWFFTIFVDGFRPELMLRIWDCFLLEGDKVLFRFALAILYITQDDLLKMHDFSTMSSHLSKLVSTRALDMEHLFETFTFMNPLSGSTLRSRREFHRSRIQALLDE